jgi:integrase/recombinase XerD
MLSKSLKFDPREELVVQLWRDWGYARNTIQLYRAWIRRLQPYLRRLGGRVDEHLEKEKVENIGRRYARARGVSVVLSVKGARSASRLWARGLSAIGVEIPRWVKSKPPSKFETILFEFESHRLSHRGVKKSTIKIERRYVGKFLEFLQCRRRPLNKTRITDIDSFLSRLLKSMKKKTVAGAASAIRVFLRFLHVSGRIPTNLAPLVRSPMIGKGDCRVLPWNDVRRILRAINRRSTMGKRDFSMLLTMACYGMRAGELLGLRLDDINWKEETIRLTRPKNNTITYLPLLPAVAQSLAIYIREARPKHTSERQIFISTLAPYCSLKQAGSICYLLKKYAASAGIQNHFLGSHVLRHSHASRQIESAVPAKIVADILGHTDPKSVSTYTRVAIKRLRAIALPVPR